jgi:hypothetical protein
MIARYSSLLVVFCVITAAEGLSTHAAAQQTQASAAGDWVVPRTPDGHPDFQGTWTNETITPFERPEDQESPTLTLEQVQERQGGAVARIERGARPSDPDRAAPRAGGSVGGYNNVYMDRGINIAIVNGEFRSSLLTHPSDGRRPDLTPEGERRRAAQRAIMAQFEQYDHPEIRGLGERCIMSFGSSAGPPMIPNTAYNNNYTFVQTADHILIMSEMVHDARIIRIGDGPRLPSHIRPWMGDSWGRWEGDALVVETTNLNPIQAFRGIRPTEDLKVTERFTRVEGGILYEFTVDDPTTYTESWGGEIPFRPLNDRVYEYACHEGNYALSNILSGARYQERLEAEEEANRR